MKYVLVLTLLVSLFYIIRMIYYQIYEKKASIITAHIEELEKTYQKSIKRSELSKNLIYLVKGFAGVREYLYKCDNVKYLRDYNKLTLNMLDEEIKILKNNEDYEKTLSIVNIFEYDIRNIWNLYAIEYRNKISNSRGYSTLFAIISTIIANLVNK